VWFKKPDLVYGLSPAIWRQVAATESKRVQKRANLPLGADDSPEQRVVNLTVALLSERCGAAFGRGFRLKAIGRRLYVQLSGRKAPLYLDFDAGPTEVQERATQLREHLRAADGVFDAEEWAIACATTRARKGKDGRRSGQGPKRPPTLAELSLQWRRLKLAEGIQERTFDTGYAPLLNRLDPLRPLSEESMLTAIESTAPGSWTRRRILSLLKRLCAVSGVSWNDALFEPMRARRGRSRRVQPFFLDEEIEALVLPTSGLEASWRRVLALMAVYGLRPWEAWVAEPCRKRPGCAWVSQGKTNLKGQTPARQVPPFHAEWLQVFRMTELWKVPLPALNDLSFAGNRVNQKLRRRKLVLDPGKTAYGFRHAYARRLHSPRYRVTDAHAALFMGHTVAVHNTVYRDWIGGDDPLDLYLDRLG
jgi:integrase